MELTGTLKEKFATEQVTDKFAKREFILETTTKVKESEFTDLIKFQLTQDRCKVIEEINEGTEIKVYFNIRGRGWENKEGTKIYFNSLEAWKVETMAVAPVEEAPEIPEEQQDDLPF